MIFSAFLFVKVNKVFCLVLKKSRLWNIMSKCCYFSPSKGHKSLIPHILQHFTRRGKPWSSPRDVRGRLYRFGYEDEAEGAFERWFQVAHSVCPWMVEELPSRGEEEEWKKFLVT